MSVLHRIPEERISAVLGVPAIVAGLGAGLDRSTYSNSREMAEWFTERKLIPQWRSDAAKLNVSLLPDFTSNRLFFVEFDITNVRALQEDMDAKYTRLQLAVGKPWMTINEARSEIGMDAVDGGDELSEPEPPPPPIPPTPPAPETADEEQPDQQTGGGKAMPEDIGRWEHKVINAVKKGKPANVDFKSDAIPLEVHERVMVELAKCKTQEDVRQVFANVELAAHTPAEITALLEGIKLGVEALRVSG